MAMVNRMSTVIFEESLTSQIDNKTTQKYQERYDDNIWIIIKVIEKKLFMKIKEHLNGISNP